MSKNMIEMRGIIKRYFIGQPNELQILNSVTFNVAEGEFVAIVGPSGSGKSTLMNMIGALDKPTEGTYHLNGTDIGRLNDKQLSEIRNKEIGFVFQTFNLIPRTTALKNVALPMMYAGIGKKERLERAKELIKLISLEMLDELDEKYPNIYQNAAGGEMSFVTIRNARGEDVAMELAGAFEGYLKAQSHKIIAGRNLTLRDNLEYKNTAVVSEKFVKKYFINGEEPIGKTLSVNCMASGRSYEFTIVGVYRTSEFMEKMMEQEMGMDDPDAIPTEMIVPMMSAYKTIANETFTGLTYIRFIADRSVAGDVATEQLRTFFEEKYADSPKIEVEVWSNAEDMAIVNKAIALITLIISVIAAISLLVGGVGVMNIMLVSVTERTREIGIRKALGAKRRNIRVQFIIESIVICLIGGIIGILVGILNGELICIVARKLVAQSEEYRVILSSVVVQPSAVAIVASVVFSTLTGVFFGWYPANKASKMNPIDALRYD